MASLEIDFESGFDVSNIASELLREHTCFFCGATFKEIHNLGLHRCSYHPEPMGETSFPCCGGTRKRLGCRRSDHVRKDHYERGIGAWTRVISGDRYAALLASLVENVNHKTLVAEGGSNWLIIMGGGPGWTMEPKKIRRDNA